MYNLISQPVKVIFVIMAACVCVRPSLRHGQLGAMPHNPQRCVRAYGPAAMANDERVCSSWPTPLGAPIYDDTPKAIVYRFMI